jgi:tetratricopeptide (TPR) repeat protein
MKPFALTALLGLALIPWAAAVQAGESPKPGEIPEQVRRAAIDGRFLLMQGRLDEAVQKLQTALSLYPDQPEAKDLLAQALAKRAEAQQHFDQAGKLAQAGKWDEAILEINAATGVYPAYKQAKDLGQDIRRRAANATVVAATAMLGKGNLPGAEDAFRRALEYVPDFAPALEGIGRADFERAKAAEAQGRWGAALAWVTEAIDFAPKKAEYADLAGAMRARVLERVRFAIAKGPPRPATEVVSAATAVLEEKTWQRLGRSRPEFLVVAGDPAFTGAAAYLVALDATEPQVRGGLARTEQRTFRYTIKREEPNPDYANMRDQLNRARDYLTQLRADYDQPCPYCGGGGVLLCRACGGTGTIIGPPPGPCPYCNMPGGRPGYVRCPRCGGTGHYSRVSYTELRRAEQEVARLQDLLLRTPPMVTRTLPADWAYSLEYHEKSGVMEFTLRILSAERGRNVVADTIRRDKRYEDALLQNANPAIGLAADPLKLPADVEVRATILDDAAAEAANRIVAATAAARAAERQAESQKLFSEGHVPEAIEADADAAILKEAGARGQGMVLVGALRDRLRAEERRAKPAGTAAGGSSGI